MFLGKTAFPPVGHCGALHEALRPADDNHRAHNGLGEGHAEKKLGRREKEATPANRGGERMAGFEAHVPAGFCR